MSITLPTIDARTAKIVSDLNNVTGRRIVTIQTRTMPSLKTKHPFASTTGRATCDDHGLIKVARWDHQVGDRGLYEFLVNCLWQVIGKSDAKGNPRDFKATGDAFYERVTRVDGTAYPWAVATPKGKTEAVMYLPGAVMKTHEHFYECNGVLVPNDQVDGVWTRPDYAPKTQEIDPADRFIRWRAPKLANIASVENIGDEITEGGCVEEFRQAVERFRDAKGLTNEQVAELFTVPASSVAAQIAANATA